MLLAASTIDGDSRSKRVSTSAAEGERKGEEKGGKQEEREGEEGSWT